MQFLISCLAGWLERCNLFVIQSSELKVNVVVKYPLNIDFHESGLRSLPPPPSEPQSYAVPVLPVHLCWDSVTV